MTANREQDETGTPEMVVLRTPDGTWYELQCVDAGRAAELDAAAVGTADVAGFGFTSGELWEIGGGREWHVAKITPSPTGGLTVTETVRLAPPPSTRFPDGAIYRA
jgi:hypothetical protein